jgi:hypothetical protein
LLGRWEDEKLGRSKMKNCLWVSLPLRFNSPVVTPPSFQSAILADSLNVDVSDVSAQDDEGRRSDKRVGLVEQYL